MPAAAISLVDAPEALRTALTPVRRQLLARLREPASAVVVAGEFGLARQKVNYHLRALEDAGFLELVETRPRRGCLERVLRTSARAFVVDPGVMAPAIRPTRAPRGADAERRQDRFAAETLVDAAAGVVREVSRMQANADAAGTRLLTCAIEADVRLASPADFAALSATLATLVARAIADVGVAEGGRAYRVVVGAHPKTRPQKSLAEKSMSRKPASPRSSPR